MDPNECLKMIRGFIQEMHECNDFNESQHLGDELAHAVDALDNWISKGGFLPKDWER